MSLIRIIATFILIYLVFRLFTSLVIPWLIRWYLNRFKKKFYEQNPHLRQEEEEQTRKGKSKVRITYKRSEQGGKSLDDVGEYVDFEDIDNEKNQQQNNNKKKKH